MAFLARIASVLDIFLSPELRKQESGDIMRMRCLAFAILVTVPLGFMPCFLFRDPHTDVRIWFYQAFANLLVSVGLLWGMRRLRDYRRVARWSVIWMHGLFAYSLLAFPTLFSLIYLWSSFIVVLSCLILGLRGALVSVSGLTALSLGTTIYRFLGETPWMTLEHESYLHQLILSLVGSSVLTAAVTGVYEYMRDSSEQQRARQRLIAARHAHTGAVGELVGHMAHEVNNPLAILQGSVTRLKRLLQRDERSHEGRKLLANMQRSHERIIRVQQALAIFASGHEHEPFVSHDIRLVLRDVQLAMKPQAQAHQVALHFHEFGRSLIVRCQPHQLVYVLCSLIQNSLDACRDHASPEIHVRLREGNAGLSIAVTDNGKGIDPSVHERVFQPFFTTKSGGNVQGLSLSVSRGILARHGGEIHFTSQPGSTTFTCELPREAISELPLAKGA